MSTGPDNQAAGGRETRFRPSPMSVALGPLWFWTAMASAMLMVVWLRPRAEVWAPAIAGVLVALGLFRLGAEILGWLLISYRLTSTHAEAAAGILRRVHATVPLDSVERVTVYQRLRDMPFGLGSIRIETAASGGGGMWWVMVNEPEKLAQQVRDAAAASRNKHAPAPVRPLVIGLTGSIAAGKSAAASIFRELGCVVVDSDADARAALDLPEVRESLVSWWGGEILTPDGKVDRKAVGQIVFAKPEERARLERLVHPIVRRTRDSLIAQAASSGASVVVADVPLLFEAGVDAECDLTVYVDAPRELRLARAKERGWDDAELERREAAQLPVAEKLKRADERIVNAGSLDELKASIRDVLARASRRPK